jgi:hypothetical protein
MPGLVDFLKELDEDSAKSREKLTNGKFLQWPDQEAKDQELWAEASTALQQAAVDAVDGDHLSLAATQAICSPCRRTNPECRSTPAYRKL